MLSIRQSEKKLHCIKSYSYKDKSVTDSLNLRTTYLIMKSHISSSVVQGASS